MRIEPENMAPNELYFTMISIGRRSSVRSIAGERP
jgi:hypothetical protein